MKCKKRIKREKMLKKVKKVVFVVLGFTGFIAICGVVGGIECGTIELIEGILQAILGTLFLTVGFGFYGKLEDSDYE